MTVQLGGDAFLLQRDHARQRHKFAVAGTDIQVRQVRRIVDFAAGGLEQDGHRFVIDIQVDQFIAIDHGA